MFNYMVNNKNYFFDEEKLCISDGTIIKYLCTDDKDDAGHIYIKLSSSCNLRCIYCFQNSYSCVSKSVDFGKFKKLILKLIDLDKDFVLYGGEPFLEENINFINEFMSSLPKNRKVRSFSNGFFSENVLKVLDEYKNKLAPIVISIDGPPEIHNKRRIGESGDTFASILHNCKKMKLYGIDFIVQINVDINNISYLEKIVDILLLELNNQIDILINPVMHTKLSISEPTLLSSFVKVRERFDCHNVAVNSVVLNRLSSILTNKGIVKNRCSVGDNLIFDFEKLQIYTCTANSKSIIGSFTDSEIKLYDKKIIKYKIQDNCNKKCKYRNVCSHKCLYDMSNNLINSDFDCITNTAKSLEIIFDNFEIFFKQK